MAVNDTPVLVLHLLPIFVALAAKGAMPASKTLIQLNAAVLIGGMATTIGTSINILVTCFNCCQSGHAANEGSAGQGSML